MERLGSGHLGAATLFFALFLLASLGITWVAARRTRDTADFLVAGARVGPLQNGLALAGDFLAATGFLGISGLIALIGFGGATYSIGAMAGWPLMTFLLAEPLRRLGRYTIADVLTYRFDHKAVRLLSALGSLAVLLMFSLMSMVGAGGLVRLLLGFSYAQSVWLVGGIMLVYVLLGGMIATTWVQVVKCVIMMASAIALAAMVLARFGFSPGALFAAAAVQNGPGVLYPGSATFGSWEFLSAGISTVIGVASLPHVLMRFFTVRDAAAARQSLVYATGLIGLNMLIVFVVGFGGMVLVGSTVIRAVEQGGNMTIPLLAFRLGGPWFFGFFAAVAFATILASFCGLVMTGVATLCHDLWGGLIRGGRAGEREQFVVAKLCTVLFCLAGVGLGIGFEGQNIAFLSGLASSIAASTNFPALVMVLFWPRFTARGAIFAMVTGLLACLLLVWLSPFIQVQMLGRPGALIGINTPGIIAIPLAFAAGIIGSLADAARGGSRRFAELERALVGEGRG